ncbi:dissimilatory sulfite reductase D family protein [Desulfobaculum bizertense]|uniref:Dissimilatory sulfite reductase D (DsrD) n=1 Tax=Desulfobaculum bizertense DSM 18034 TaxID=1121442 RepID=A0A1T4WIT7_9BACT|nr:dissimilatory sulfite reductase D family protein [Desulfobaculum bizertense]UIJ37157.1 dissimilatory sulfite reductase D family protein [Desulfobaculum bizertense]SKA77254.1 Dissimilatory sulfite reductase D (DsrD) [Desulfobaculum bizertense DSM 18034]
MAALDLAEAKEKVIEFCHSKKKTKFYFNDFLKVFPDNKAREVKKVLTALVNEEIMEFWSSGSTTMYGLKGEGKQANAEGED